MYSSYTAASFARIYDLAERHGVNLEGALTWAFEFEDQPFFAGFRSLASNGIDKPVLNVFRLFGKMSGRRIPVESDRAAMLEEIVRKGVRAAPDISALASLDVRKLCVLAWHYHDDDVPGPDADIELKIDGLPPTAGAVTLEHFRIDADHSNAFVVWKNLGSPPEPTPDQRAQLEKAGHLAPLGPAQALRVESGKAGLRFKLPRQAVSLLQLTW